MTITFYRTSSEPNRIDKSLTTLGSTELLVGYGNKSLDKINPTIRIKVNIDSFQKLCNYAYIDEFERYYFVQSINIVDGGLYELTMHVDVLKTYKSIIASSNGLVVRSGSVNNKFIADQWIPIGNKNPIQVIEFSQGFQRKSDTIIVTYGGGGTKLL